MGFIYKITNDVNGKMYIGKTELLDPEKRWKEHLSDFKRRKCEKRPLYDAMNKYGIEHFHFEVIEETESAEEREVYWINELRTYIGFDDCNGYNATLGGEGKCHLNLDEDKVVQYHTSEACYLIGATAHYFDVDEGTIRKILKKTNTVWLNSRDASLLKIYEDKAGVFQISLNPKYVLNIFENVKEANIYMDKNPNSHNINNACLGKNNGGHYAYGYLWYYGKDLYKVKDELMFIY